MRLPAPSRTGYLQFLHPYATSSPLVTRSLKRERPRQFSKHLSGDASRLPRCPLIALRHAKIELASQSALVCVDH